MSWDSKTVPRRRQNSNAASGRSRGLSLHNRTGSKAIPGSFPSTPVKIDPKSAHTSDPFLQEFLNPAFDPVGYLNATLPPLQGGKTIATGGGASSNNGKSSVPLAGLSTEAQTLITQLNAHTTRLTATLTQLTEDILRSGSRLAYEVELLRGETMGLAEALTEGPLRADLERFVPGGLENAVAAAAAASTRRASLVSNAIPPTPATAVPGAIGDNNNNRDFSSSPVPPITPGVVKAFEEGGTSGGGVERDDDPPYISQLRTLTLVRARLDSVIKTFGDAMEFVFPPSEISVSSGFLSVSAPDFPDRHSGSAEQISTEDKGQLVLKKLRDEIADLLKSGSASNTHDDKIKGVEDATKRVEEIKELSIVWKGTAEEKGRQRFVEGLARMVEERHRELVKEVEAQRERETQSRRDDSAGPRRELTGPSEAAPAATESKGPLGGYGFMNQWQKIRGGL